MIDYIRICIYLWGSHKEKKVYDTKQERDIIRTLAWP